MCVSHQTAIKRKLYSTMNARRSTLDANSLFLSIVNTTRANCFGPGIWLSWAPFLKTHGTSYLKQNLPSSQSNLMLTRDFQTSCSSSSSSSTSCCACSGFESRFYPPRLTKRDRQSEPTKETVDSESWLNALRCIVRPASCKSKYIYRERESAQRIAWTAGVAPKSNIVYLSYRFDWRPFNQDGRQAVQYGGRGNNKESLFLSIDVTCWPFL